MKCEFYGIDMKHTYRESSSFPESQEQLQERKGRADPKDCVRQEPAHTWDSMNHMNEFVFL